jgi:hypothetical protein
VNRRRKKRTREQWLAVRKEARLTIDPDTAEVFWIHGEVCDPYGVYDLPDEAHCIGRNYFARSPGSDVWVSFGDLPDATRDRLWARRRAGDFRYNDIDWKFSKAEIEAADVSRVSGGACSL